MKFALTKKCCLNIHIYTDVFLITDWKAHDYEVIHLPITNKFTNAHEIKLTQQIQKNHLIETRFPLWITEVTITLSKKKKLPACL